MKTPLPSNQDLEAFSQAIPWKLIEKHKRRFQDIIAQLRSQDYNGDELPLDTLSEAVGTPVETQYDTSKRGNVIYTTVNGKKHILASVVSQRFRKDKPLIKSITPYNFNPCVNHTNIHETDDPLTKMRALGAELELGLYHRDGSSPTEDEMQSFIQMYRANAHRRGITPNVDREACQFQVEVHVAPGVGYYRTRQSLDSIMSSLVAAGRATGLNTAILSAYPIKSDFNLTPDPKVRTAVDVMEDINGRFPQFGERLASAKARYHINPDANFVETFRLQGCHIHLDLAGRSEGLGLLTFYTMLRSATAIANAAVLKGGPFVNGTCDAERLCTREYLRSTTVTGSYIEMPISPHLTPGGWEKYSNLLHSERANAVVRALLYQDNLGEPFSSMHNPIGRVRPDLGTSKRICTIESTGMPVNISASRQAAILTDFEFTHALIEHYYRHHGCDLSAMYEDQDLWAIVGPLSTEDYIRQQNLSDHEGTDMTITTANGMAMSLAEFYEMKRLYMHRHLIDAIQVTPRDIDDVYTSLSRMLNPPSGRSAQTIRQYIVDPTLRSTGNWGMILRNAFIEAGGTPGNHDPDAVLKVANQIHDALCERYS